MVAQINPQYEMRSANFDLEDIGAFRQWVIEEFQQLEITIAGLEHVLLQVMHVEPAKPRNGMIVLADGTNWNPGSGAGFYGRSAGSWVKLG